MLDLKEIFSASQEMSRPATPPPGQWAAIQKGIDGFYATGSVTAPAPASSLSAGFFTGLGTGLATGVALTLVIVVLFFRGGEPPTVQAATDQLKSAVLAGHQPSPLSPVISVSKTGTPVPTQAIARSSFQLVPLNPPAGSGLIVVPPLQPDYQTTLNTAAFGNPPVGLKPELAGTFEREYAGSFVREESGANGKNVAVVRLPELTRASAAENLAARMTHVLITPPDTTFLRGSGRKSRWHFQPTPLRQDPAPYWEIGLHASPWLSSLSFRDGPDEYTESPPGPLTAPFVLADGETVNLERVRSLDQFYRKQLYANQFHLAGSRQLGNGLTFGGGLLWEDYGRGDFDQADNFVANVPEGGWVYLAEEKYNILSATLTTGYTFRRRMRLRYSAGVMATGQVYSRFAEKGALLEQATGILHPQRSLTTINHHFLPVIRLRPVLGVQYQLAKSLSVGLEVSTGLDGFQQVPEFGLGGRWQFR